jgi:hypothetical protein
MDQADRTRIAAEASQRFLATFEASDKDGLNNVDLSGSPSLRKTINEKFERCDKDGLNNVDTSGLPVTNQLKQFLTTPDIESLRRVGQETNNPDILTEVTDQREQAEAEAFIAQCPDYIRDDENYELIREWILQHGLEWTSHNLQRAFRALCRSGAMQALGAPRNLTQSQKLLVIASAKSGRIDEAVSQYLDFALPDASDRYIDANDFLADVGTLSLRNEAVCFVWFHSRPVQDSEAWKQFQRKWFRRRPMITIADLDQAWTEFQKEDKLAMRDRLIYGQPESAPTEKEIDALDDAGVDKLFHQTLRHYAQTAKKSAGILV